MKKLVLIIVLSFISLFAFAKKDIDLSKFNKELNSNIETVIKNNPQTYETKNPLGRGPASVGADEKEKLIKESERQNQLKKIQVGSPNF